MGASNAKPKFPTSYRAIESLRRVGGYLEQHVDGDLVLRADAEAAIRRLHEENVELRRRLSKSSKYIRSIK